MRMFRRKEWAQTYRLQRQPRRRGLAAGRTQHSVTVACRSLGERRVANDAIGARPVTDLVAAGHEGRHDADLVRVCCTNG